MGFPQIPMGSLAFNFSGLVSLQKLGIAGSVWDVEVADVRDTRDVGCVLPFAGPTGHILAASRVVARHPQKGSKAGPCSFKSNHREQSAIKSPHPDHSRPEVIRSLFSSLWLHQQS